MALSTGAAKYTFGNVEKPFIIIADRFTQARSDRVLSMGQI